MPGTFKIVIPSGTVSADLTNYPVCLLIKSSSSLSGIDLTEMFDELGSNNLKMQVFISDKVTECYVEVATWDVAGENGELHFLAPSVLSGSDNVFYLHYNKDMADNTTYVGVTGSVPAQAVWDSDFIYVYHMNDGSTNANFKDSTSHSYDGTKSAAGTPAEILGSPGKAQDLDGAAGYLDISQGNGLDCGREFTHELFLRNDAAAGTYPTLFNRAGQSKTLPYWWTYTGGTGEATIVHQFGTGNGVNYGSVSWSAWSNTGLFWYLAFTHTDIPSDLWELIVNNVSKGQKAGNFPYVTLVSTSYLEYGNYRRTTDTGYLFDGPISEARLSSIVRSTAWRLATNLTLHDQLTTITDDTEGRMVLLIWR